MSKRKSTAVEGDVDAERVSGRWTEKHFEDHVDQLMRKLADFDCIVSLLSMENKGRFALLLLGDYYHSRLIGVSMYDPRGVIQVLADNNEHYLDDDGIREVRVVTYGFLIEYGRHSIWEILELKQFPNRRLCLCMTDDPPTWEQKLCLN